MNRAQLAISLAGVLLVGAAAGYWFGHRGKIGTEPTAERASRDQSGRKVLYWHDPMVPGRRFDRPGKSPFMDMDLVPVYAEEEPAGAAVHVSPAVTQNLGIRLGKVEKRVLQEHLAAVGSVAFDDRLLQLVQARVEGYVTRLHVKTPLEAVRRGQPLADIVSPEWLAAQEEYLALLGAQSERGQSIRSAARQRLVVLGVPEGTIRAIEAGRGTQAATTVFAPIDGVVTELSVREGAAFMPGAALFRINGLGTVWVNAQVPESQVSMIPVGSSVTARAAAWPGAMFEGRVLALLPEVEAQTRTLSVRLEIANPEAKLAPGMFVSLDFMGKAAEPQLVVPSEAVIATGERNVVIVARDNGGFDVADVTVGPEVNGRTAILSGLSEGQSIVLSGQFLIDSESSLRSAVDRISAVTTGPSMHPERALSAHLSGGRVTAITPESVTIAHDPVPSLNWPAMTMTFKAPPSGFPAGTRVGDRVSFSFSEAEAGGYQIESITTVEQK